METEGVKYAGSKLRLLPYIGQIVRDRGFTSVLDGFSGTTRVSQAFAQMGFAVTSNDVAHWSEAFALCYLKSAKPDSFYAPLIDELNSLDGVEGWFAANYGGEGADGCKKPFQRRNAMKIDAIRERIDSFRLDKTDTSVLLSSLMLAMDAVDSTLGHYVSYLKHWSRRSYKPLTLRLPRRFATDPARHTVLRGDVFDAIRGRSFDLAYFDPPYGSNNEKMPPSRIRYGAYYHIWKSVVLNDKPEVFGKAARRVDSRDAECASVFEDFRRGEDGRFLAISAIDELLGKTDAPFILLSYSSGGRATREELLDSIASHGRLVQAVSIDYRSHVMSSMSWTGDWKRDAAGHQEYLFLVEKS